MPKILEMPKTDIFTTFDLWYIQYNVYTISFESTWIAELIFSQPHLAYYSFGYVW